MGARGRMSTEGREGVVPCSMFMIMREPCVLWNHLADEGLRRRCVDSLYVCGQVWRPWVGAWRRVCRLSLSVWIGIEGLGVNGGRCGVSLYVWTGMKDLGGNGDRCGVSLYFWTGMEDLSRNGGRCGVSLYIWTGMKSLGGNGDRCGGFQYVSPGVEGLDGMKAGVLVCDSLSMQKNRCVVVRTGVVDLAMFGGGCGYMCDWISMGNMCVEFLKSFRYKGKQVWRSW